MNLVLYDRDERVRGISPVANDQQAVLEVLRSFADKNRPDLAHSVVRWVLYDGVGKVEERCVWERAPDSRSAPKITKRAERFKGVWQDGGTAIRAT